MDDLVVFLAARIDEDEAAAYKAAGGLYRGADGRFGGRPHWSALGHGIVTDAADPDWAIVDLGPCIDDDALAEHVARHDPARVLRDVAAWRAIIGEQVSDHAPIESMYGLACRTCVAWQDDEEAYEFGIAISESWPCRVARAAAAVYCGHPDYRPEWKP